MEKWPYPYVLIATGNKNKLKQFADLFCALGLNVKGLQDIQTCSNIVEDQDSFTGNAIKKAETISLEIGIPVIADDSGLVIPALNGNPGIYSARFAGPDADDEKNNQKLIRLLANVPQPCHGKFVCVMALAIPGEKTVTVRGECNGVIIKEPRGDYGFGYDPIFLIPEEGKTMAELLPEKKYQISHRAIATQKLMQILKGKFDFNSSS